MSKHKSKSKPKTRDAMQMIPLLESMDLNDAIRKNVEDMMSKLKSIRDDRERELQEMRKDKEIHVRRHFNQLLIAVPSNLQSMTFGQLQDCGAIIEFCPLNGEGITPKFTIDLTKIKNNEQKSNKSCSYGTATNTIIRSARKTPLSVRKEPKPFTGNSNVKRKLLNVGFSTSVKRIKSLNKNFNSAVNCGSLSKKRVIRRSSRIGKNASFGSKKKMTVLENVIDEDIVNDDEDIVNDDEDIVNDDDDDSENKFGNTPIKSLSVGEVSQTPIKSSSMEELSQTPVKSSVEEVSQTPVKSTSMEEVNQTLVKSASMEEVSQTPVKSASMEEVNQTLVKSASMEEVSQTPSFRLRVMSINEKNPRLPKWETDKEVMICSIMGTPLAVDEQWLQIHLNRKHQLSGASSKEKS